MNVTINLENLNTEEVGKLLQFMQAKTEPAPVALPQQGSAAQIAARPPIAPPIPQGAQPPAAPQMPPPVQAPTMPMAYPPPAQAAPLQQPPMVPVAPLPQYTFDQLQLACGTLMDGGKGGELQGLLAKYQINRLPELRPEAYGAFATDLRSLGARI